MSRTQIALALVIVVEFAVGGWLSVRRVSRATPPSANLEVFDAITAAELRSAIDTGGRTASGWAALGDRFLGTGFEPEAEACFREAASLEPGDPELAFKHGFSLERLGLAAAANSRYRTAIELGHPRRAELLYYVGRNELRLDHPEEASRAFEEAGDLPAARFERARIDARTGHVAEATAELKYLIESYPTTQQPVAILYRIALARGDANADRLADQFEHQPGRLANPFDTEFRWVELNRESTGLLRRRKRASEEAERGRFAESEVLLREDLDVQWTRVSADHLAEARLRQGQAADAVQILEEANRRDGPAFNVTWRLADAYDAVGRSSEARREWERAARIGTGPELKDLFVRLADVFERAGDGSRARKIRVEALIAAGVGSLDAGHPLDAFEFLAEATRLDATSASGWYWLGESLRAGGRSLDARTAYERCLKIDPDHGRAIRALRLIGA